MQILVTGAAGFIGAAVADRLLARGDSVVGIDNLNDYYQVSLKRDRIARVEGQGTNRFRFIEADFSDEDALNRALENVAIDRIVHLGAQAGVRYSIDNPRAYLHSNLGGHLEMLELARQRELGHLVYASSSSVYGGNESVPFAVDDRVDHPMSLYAATKKADELMSETYAHLYRIPQTGLRFFTVYGPWGRPDMMLWKFTDRILKGEPIPVFNHGEMWRDFTYIDDIVSGVVAALDNPPADDGSAKAGGSTKPHAIYNIGNHKSEHLMKVIGVIEEACGRKAEVEMLPMQAGDVPRTFANIDAIANDLGYAPTTSIEDGVPAFVRWFREYHGV
ncbi:SDR family NAD(P)-dependent oxidoreductase [Alteriqipengyuania flavescens]|uniref:SDR family NAD(P)-dependent oxidoreductase n=1 Tax=Alteriqipengyuania flavescens TaxID=3053610 RepID=UPI0025B43F1C|nr:SDR family NAD(P)-dependent oxidoreductase [Alteriqipengyuania flavescens]WJY19302.1 SDR family NAD(P)-dependent oxidoreductase [Alteriqipengyuania flavescens]WJY25243.1 SDR family NAD(P)-dependent oxidoreductase [Alteriqipengyuania flavescens]